MVYIDVQKFERVMDNIVINSIRYTPELGMIKIRCNIDEDKIYITVCDSGSGFNQKDLTHVFERFTGEMYLGHQKMDMLVWDFTLQRSW